MKDKGIGTGIVIIIVIVVVAGGIGGYMVLSGGDSPESGSPTEGTGGGTGGGTSNEELSNLSSIRFTVTVTATDNADSGQMKFAARNLVPGGEYESSVTSDTDLLVLDNRGAMEAGYIFRNSTETGYMRRDWTDGWESFESLDSDYTSQWTLKRKDLVNYINHIQDDEMSWTYLGKSYEITDLKINPDLPDSTFEPS